MKTIQETTWYSQCPQLIHFRVRGFEPQSLWCLQTQMAVEPGNQAMAAGLLDFYRLVHVVLYVILGCYFGMIFWDENLLLFTFLTGKLRKTRS